MKLYKAMIWTRDAEEPGQRVSVLAETLTEAKDELEAKYGKGNVFDLQKRIGVRVDF